MGAILGQEVKHEKLTEDMESRVMEVFAIVDKDGSKSITKDEALNHFNNKHAQISADKLINQADANKDGTIKEAEFVRFWEIAKAHGVTEEEMDEELDNIANGETWAGFQQMPNLA